MAGESPEWKAEQYDSVYASLGTLQVRLDEALQKHHDDAAAHGAAVEAMKIEHAAALAALHDQFNAQRELVEGNHIAEIDTLAGSLRAEHAATLATKDEAHARHVAELKATVLVPALKDLHARQAADAAKAAAELAARQQAELDALK